MTMILTAVAMKPEAYALKVARARRREYNAAAAAYASWELGGGCWWCQRPHPLSAAAALDAARAAVSVAEARLYQLVDVDTYCAYANER